MVDKVSINANVEIARTDSVTAVEKNSKDINIFENNQVASSSNKSPAEIKELIQQKKDRIEYLKTKIEPLAQKKIKFGSTFGLAALAGSFASSVALGKGATALSLALFGQIGAIVVAAGAIGYAAGNLLNHIQEKNTNEEILKLENEIKCLEEQLGNSSYEI